MEIKDPIARWFARNLRGVLPLARMTIKKLIQRGDAPARWVGPRGRRILHTGLWSLVAKITAAANLFITVPFVLHALGPTQFGVWATLVSLIAFAGFLDFGLGNGTMNLIAAAQGRGSNAEIGSILRESRRILTKIAIALAAVAGVALPLIPWQRILGISEALSNSTRAAVGAVLFTIVLAIPLNLANRVQLGLGRGDRAFRWQAAGQVLAAATVILLARAGATLELLVAAAVATPLLASVANTWQLWRDPFFLSPDKRARDPKIAADIRNEGLLFFVLQLAAATAFFADLPLISALRGPEEAGTYAIVQRLFSVIPLGLGLLWAPLWPIYRQALAAGDHRWVLRTLRVSLLSATSLALVAGFMLTLGFDFFTGLWLQGPLVVSGLLVAGFAIWSVFDAAGSAIVTFLNAASIMRYQIIVGAIFAVACIAGKAWVIMHVGVWAVPWVTATTFLLANLLPTIAFWPRLIAIAETKGY